MFNFLKKNNADKKGVIVLFDIGGTKMRVAVSRDGKTFGAPETAPTPQDFDEGMSMLKKLADEARGGAEVKAVSGGVPGILNRGHNSVFNLPNLPKWNGKPLKSDLEKIFGAQVYIENDAALAGLGEATSGAGKGYNIVVYITVSTGVGGARIVNGKIDQKVFGFEPGHQIINDGDGYLGAYISGAALEHRFGKKPADITDKNVLDNFNKCLAVGLYNSILHWSPEVVVLGGPLILGGQLISIEKVEEELRRLLEIFPEIPVIKKAALGDLGGLHGALEFVSKELTPVAESTRYGAGI